MRKPDSAQSARCTLTARVANRTRDELALPYVERRPSHSKRCVVVPPPNTRLKVAAPVLTVAVYVLTYGVIEFRL